MEFEELSILLIVSFLLIGFCCLIYGYTNPVIFDVMIIFGYIMICVSVILVVGLVLYVLFVK